MQEDDPGEGRVKLAHPDAVARASRWGAVLEREAGSRGLTAEALADRSGIPEDRVRQMLDDPSQLTMLELELLASILPIDIDEFLRMVIEYRAADEPQPSVEAWIIQHLSGHGE